MDYRYSTLHTVFDVRAVINIAYYKLPTGYVFPGEQHDFWEMIYVDRGSLILTAGTETLLLQAGELFFHCPNEFHAFHSPGISNLLVVSFVCDSDAMGQLVHQAMQLQPPERGYLQSLVAEASRAYEHFENDPPRIDLRKKGSAPWGSDQLIKSFLEQLLITLCRRGTTIPVAQRTITSGQAHRHWILAQQAKDYLELHYTEKVSLSSLAAVLGTSVTQLKRVFREQIGQSFVEYLTALRISEARRLIRQGELNFTQIALRVGYESIYYFSALFKKQTGMSLTEYSKSLKG